MTEVKQIDLTRDDQVVIWNYFWTQFSLQIDLTRDDQVVNFKLISLTKDDRVVNWNYFWTKLSFSKWFFYKKDVKH